jgi:hypothetical protein
VPGAEALAEAALVPVDVEVDVLSSSPQPTSAKAAAPTPAIPAAPSMLRRLARRVCHLVQ